MSFHKYTLDFSFLDTNNERPLFLFPFHLFQAATHEVLSSPFGTVVYRVVYFQMGFIHILSLGKKQWVVFISQLLPKLVFL